ncbi:acyltransferase [Telmatobacter sp. DSM 110680]|uniref:Acyltransferase n=1 Tax=Telmatobacter sp. DSM 110680 TaxID=3036704 RepID=A0AAU7DKY1_9BACT
MEQRTLPMRGFSAVASLRDAARSRFFLIDLDKKDTAILKGLAIVAIVFHNFFHVIGPVRENEFNFDPARFPIFLQTVIHPSMAIQSLFAFYGHFGVQVFIFLSAYGLAKSHWSDANSWSEFMWCRVKKLYPMFGLVVFFWALLAAMHLGPIWVIKDAGPKLLLMLAGVSNILPGLGLPPIGPWWFIPFIIQFYAMWLLLRRLTNKFSWQGLVVLSIVCFLITHLTNPILAHWQINLGENPIGRMRVLCLGIIAARFPIRINVFLAIPAFAIILVGSEYRAVSHLVSLASVTLILWLYTKTRVVLRKVQLLETIGNYSLAIFLVNGIVRVPFVVFAKSPLSQLLLACGSAAVTFAISAFFHYLLEPAPEPVVNTGGLESWATSETADAMAD